MTAGFVSEDDVTRALAASSVSSLKVACPSFVADCLETLEEIGLELRHTYLEAGGKQFELIPCLNSQDDFVSGLIQTLNN